MPRKKVPATPAAAPVAAPVKETTGSRYSKAVAKGKEFGKNVVDKAKAAGAKAKAAGLAAKAHVSRNKAAYIAGMGAAGVATAAGIAARNRKKAMQSEN